MHIGDTGMSSSFDEFCIFMQAVRPLLVNSTTWGRYVPGNERLWYWWMECITTDDRIESILFMRHKIFNSLIPETLSVIHCVHLWLSEPYIGCWEMKLQHVVALHIVAFTFYTQLYQEISYEVFLKNGIQGKYKISNIRCDSCVYAIIQRIEPFVLEAPLTSVQNDMTSTLYGCTDLQITEQQVFLYITAAKQYVLSLTEYRVLWLCVG